MLSREGVRNLSAQWPVRLSVALHPLRGVSHLVRARDAAGSLVDVLVRRIVARAFETNCYVVAPAAGEECVIIDPGVGVEDAVDAVLREDKLKPTAVLLSHGHLDHVFAVVPGLRRQGRPGSDPPGRPGTDGRPGEGRSACRRALRSSGGSHFGEPDDVRLLSDGETLQLAGLDIAVDHTPGHTPGSVIFRSEDRLFSGDLLFRGSVGRTDLPGGSYEQLLASLARTVLPLPDETLVHCGHNEETTVGRERATNPFLTGFQQPSPGRSPAVSSGRSGNDCFFRRAQRHVRRASDRLRDAGSRSAEGLLEPARLAGYCYIETADFRRHRTLRARGRGVDRRRLQGDVHLPRQGGALAHAAPGGHRERRARRRRAPAEPGSAAAEGLVRGADVSLRAAAVRPLPAVPAGRRRGARHRRSGA